MRYKTFFGGKWTNNICLFIYTFRVVLFAAEELLESFDCSAKYEGISGEESCLSSPNISFEPLAAIRLV